jgi:hypothetical protein
MSHRSVRQLRKDGQQLWFLHRDNNLVLCVAEPGCVNIVQAKCVSKPFDPGDITQLHNNNCAQRRCLSL